MRIVVIGATGHIGGYLVPRLVNAGHEVVAVSRGERLPYHEDPAWDAVERIYADRDAEDTAGTFGPRVAALGAEVVIDLICFTPESAGQLIEALRGRVQRLVMCSTIWVYGTLSAVPATESDRSEPWGEYGVGKAAIESLLVAESERPDGLRSTTLRPGHISGPGWRIINPLANLDLEVWEKLAHGETVVMPNFGLETVHHVHADDVAQAFQLAAELPVDAPTDAFNIVSDRALTLRGFAEEAAGWFGREAQLEYTPFDDFRAQTTDAAADTTLAHISRSHSMSIEKAKRELGYSPRHTSLEATAEAVEWLRADGQLSI